MPLHSPARVAQAASPRDSGVAGDTYGYNYRVGKVDAFTDGAKIGKFDTYTDGARVGKTDPYTDGARTVAGLDTRGVSQSPARTIDPYTDGAKSAREPAMSDGGSVNAIPEPCPTRPALDMRDSCRSDQSFQTKLKASCPVIPGGFLRPSDG